MRVRAGAAGAESGSAFVVVLWFAVAACGLALALLESSRVTFPEVQREIEAIRLRAAIASAVHVTAARIAAEELELRAGSASLAWDFDGVLLSLRVRAESGLVDLSAASFDLVQRLAEAAGFERETARTLVAMFARKRSQLHGRETDAHEEPSPFEELRPPARPGIDHPVELISALPSEIITVAPKAARLLSLVTLGSGSPEPAVELAPSEVREALAAIKDNRARVALMRAEDAATVRRRDPQDVYRLEIVAQTAGERRAVRRVTFALRPDDPRPVRIVDWSGAIIAPPSEELGREP